MKNYLSVNFQYLIKKLNCSQDEFGNMFNLNRGNVGQYIREVSVPKLDTLQRVSEYFNITLDDLVNTDLSSKENHKPNLQQVVATEQNTPSTNDKDAIIAALRETIEIQRELIETLRSRPDNTARTA